MSTRPKDSTINILAALKKMEEETLILNVFNIKRVRRVITSIHSGDCIHISKLTSNGMRFRTIVDKGKFYILRLRDER